MRVIYFTERDSPHDQRFLTALGKAVDHQVFSLRQQPCHPETPPGVQELVWPGDQPDWSNSEGWRKGVKKLSKILDEYKPDLVHAGPIQGPALAVAMAGFSPLVTMSWGSDLLLKAKRSPLMRCATGYTLERTAIFLADCDTVAKETTKYDFPEEKIVTFPWGVDLGHFSHRNGREEGAAIRRMLEWEDKFIIFCNRNWSPLYGVDLLAKAFVNAVQEHSQLRLILAGSGPQVEDIKHILAPVMDKVCLPGFINPADLTGYYCAADLFVSPSFCDGSSISLLEAMACACPVLVSDIPSNREWVIENQHGAHFKVGDYHSLKKKLILLAEDLKLEKYGQNARAMAEKKADWQDNFSSLLEAYQRAV